MYKQTKRIRLTSYCPDSPYGHSMHDIIYKVVNEERILNDMRSERMSKPKTNPLIAVNKSIASMGHSRLGLAPLYALGKEFKK